MRISYKERKTNFLTPSGLRCLAKLPTVNISAGCAHRCAYCYTKGYSVYPGDDVIELYEDMAVRIADEISRKRNKPKSVYFCPSCDPFQPVEQIQQTSFEVMKTLLEKGIGVQFVTKGRIADQTLRLFEQNRLLVCGQIGITTIDDNLRQILGPGTASVKEKLLQMERLVKAGVKISVRCDPFIHGFMDSQKQLEGLFSAVAKTGCKEAAASYLFLRSAIIKSLKQDITNTSILDKIMAPYRHGPSLPVGMKSSKGIMLPIEIRKAGFDRIKSCAEKFGISIHICGCKNSDLTTETCYITREMSGNNLF